MVETSFTKRLVDIAGNTRLAMAIKENLESPEPTPRVFLVGPTGSGKSTLAECAVSAIACENPNDQDACGDCEACNASKNSNNLFAMTNSKKVQVHRYYINCRNTSPQIIHADLDWMISDSKTLHIVHLDEADHLRRYHCDLSLTQVMDKREHANVKWIATAVNAGNLDPQFLRRFAVKVVMRRPNEEEFGEMLINASRRLQVKFENQSVLRSLITRSWQIAGHALPVLAHAKLFPEKLVTGSLVDEYPFPEGNPWQEAFFAKRK